MSRRLLFVAFFFPPVGGVSVPRVLGHARHLPDHDWAVTVLTPRASSYHLDDPSGLVAVPPKTRVIRTGIIEPHAIKQGIARLARPIARPDGGSVPSAAGGEAAGRGLLSRIRRLAFFPDDQVGWLPFGVVAAVRELRRRPAAAAILSTSSPVTAHLIAGIAARLTGTPWVAEFRDPWVGNALAHPAPWLHRALARRIERWIVRGAARSVFVTPSLTEMYRARYPQLADRFSTITNGYDLERTAPPDAPDDRGDDRGDDRPLTLVYAGTLDRPRELATFLDGLRRYDASEGEGRPIRVEFIGFTNTECSALVAKAAAERAAGTIAHLGFIPRAEARRRVAAADGTLVLLGDGPGMGLFVGGKLYEAIGADRPILAMLPKGDALNLLAELEWGTIAAPDATSVADALHRFASQPVPRGPADPERRYERSSVVAGLSAVLDAASTAAR